MAWVAARSPLMSAHDDQHPDLTVEIPPPAPPPATRFERVIGQWVEPHEIGATPVATDAAGDPIDFPVVIRRTATTSRPISASPPAQTVDALARDLARVIAARLPHTRPAPYHVANLPPGTTKRAFQDAVRRGDVVAARVGGRALVEVHDWQEYVDERRRRRARPHLRGGASTSTHTTVEPTDEDLLASVGARRTR